MPAAVPLESLKGPGGLLAAEAAWAASRELASSRPPQKNTGRLHGRKAGPSSGYKRYALNDWGAERFDQDELGQLRANG